MISPAEPISMVSIAMIGSPGGQPMAIAGRPGAWRSKTSETLPRKSSRFPESVGEFVTGTRPKMGRRRSNSARNTTEIAGLWSLRAKKPCGFHLQMGRKPSKTASKDDKFGFRSFGTWSRFFLLRISYFCRVRGPTSEDILGHYLSRSRHYTRNVMRATTTQQVSFLTIRVSNRRWKFEETTTTSFCHSFYIFSRYIGYRYVWWRFFFHKSHQPIRPSTCNQAAGVQEASRKENSKASALTSYLSDASEPAATTIIGLV